MGQGGASSLAVEGERDRPLRVAVDCRLEPSFTLEASFADALESALQALGTYPGARASLNLEQSLSDALFRLRRAGRGGLEVAFPTLEARCVDGVLSPRDSTFLRALASAVRERPVRLDLDEAILAHDEPRSLARLLPTWTGAALPRPSSVVAPAPPRPAAPAGGAMTVERGVVELSLAATYRRWTQEIESARGPQSLAALERVFTSSYVPLAAVVAKGGADERAAKACASFRASFEKAYGEAFGTFGVTGKRPKMVLDAPDLAASVGRLHRVRRTLLVLVEAFRFDLGAPLLERVLAKVGAQAEVVHQGALYASLPTTRAASFDALARGKASLRDPALTEDDEAELLAMRKAGLPRPVRLGGRTFAVVGDLALSNDPDGWMGTADVVAGLARDLGPTGLLFVFGDRGAPFDRKQRPGGATPEEVIVPAFGILAGGKSS